MAEVRKLGKRNAVRGCPRWHYGLIVQSKDSIVTFSVARDDGAAINDLRASAYRTTTTARKMGVKDLRGYEHEAREAIRGFERGEAQ